MFVKGFGKIMYRRNEKMKPEFLYHGSQSLYEILIPYKAKDNTDIGSQFAIYACEHFDEVIPFALPIRWYPDNPSGKRDYRCEDGITIVEYGSLDPNGFGYVYKLNSDNFEKIDDWQWISRIEITPVDVVKFEVKDYWHTIFFSEEALRINGLLYPSDTLYINKRYV
jgi:hypothetical protein